MREVVKYSAKIKRWRGGFESKKCANFEADNSLRMRTHLLLVLALVLASAAISGCSKKGDNPAACKLLRTDTKENGRTGYTIYDYNGSQVTHYKTVDSILTIDYNLEYDAKGRVVKITEQAEAWNATATITYNSDHILTSFVNDLYEKRTKMVYKGGGPLIAYEVDVTAGDTTFWTYKGNNVVERTSKLYDMREIVTYDDKKAFKPINFPGAPDNNILTREVVSGTTSNKYVYTYSYSASGYPATAAVKHTFFDPIVGTEVYESQETYTSDCK